MAPAYYGELASFSLDPAVAAVAAALCIVLGLGISLPPLAECLRLNLRDTLHEEGRSGTMSRRSVWMRQALIGAETDGLIEAENPFIFARITRNARTDLFATGVYRDRVLDSRGELRFRQRIVVCDSSHFDTLLAIPL